MNKNTEITITLTASQRDVLIRATRGDKEINPFNRSGMAVVNKNNVFAIREAVVDLKRVNTKAKRKNINTIQTSYECERLIHKIDNAIELFGMEVPEDEAPNEPEAVVEITPSLTREEVEVVAEEGLEVVEVTPSLTKQASEFEPVEGPVIESVPSVTAKPKPKVETDGPTVETVPSRTDSDEQDFEEPKEKPVEKKRSKRKKKDDN